MSKKELCVIVHGFGGSPWEIRPLACCLEKEGYEVMTPLLPGHNDNRVRMDKTTSIEWIHEIEEIVKNALKEQKTIHLIGFSMGAMIASIIAYRYEINTLVLLSPAVFVLTPFLLKMKFEKFQQSRKNRSLLKKPVNRKQSFIRSTSIYHLAQFHKTVRHAKGIFHHISLPICIIHGKKDPTADPKSSYFIYQTISSKEKEIHFLPLSKHHICRDCESETVNQIVVQFLKKYHKESL